MRKLIFLILIGLNFNNTVYGQLNSLQLGEKIIYFSSSYENGLADGGGTIWGVGMGYILSRKWEFNAFGGSAWSKRYDNKLEYEGYNWGIAIEYYTINSLNKPITLSFKAAYQRNTAAISPYQLTFGANLYKPFKIFKKERKLLIHLSPQFIKARELLNNRFAIEGGFLTSFPIVKHVFTVQPYYKRIFGLCCKQGNNYGLNLGIIF